jgi:hypothetical protein
MGLYKKIKNIIKKEDEFMRYDGVPIYNKTIKDCSTKDNNIIESWIEVEGYKATDKNMMCRDYQYELGKIFSKKDETIKICENGFHFSENLRGTFLYYPLKPFNRYFKVKALAKLKFIIKEDGTWQKHRDLIDDNKLVAKEIKFIEEVSIDELKPYILEKYPFLDNLEEQWNEEFIINYSENVKHVYAKKINKISNFTTELCDDIANKVFINNKNKMDEIVSFIKMLTENEISNDTIYNELKSMSSYNDNQVFNTNTNSWRQYLGSYNGLRVTP